MSAPKIAGRGQTITNVDSPGLSNNSFGGLAGYRNHQVVTLKIELFKCQRGKCSQKLMICICKGNFLQKGRDNFGKNFCPGSCLFGIHGGKKRRLRKKLMESKECSFCTSPLIYPIVNERNLHILLK